MTVTFSSTARSERHFSALLLPHLLMSNDFVGCRALFEKLGLGGGGEFGPDDIEVVAELNPIRDVAARAGEFEDAPPEQQGQVVPDLFLRMGNSALVIETKFFTHPPATDVADQLKAQRKAIERVLSLTPYEGCRFRYLALTVQPLAGREDGDTDMASMTWSDVLSVLKPVVDADGSRDTAYALEALEDAVERSTAEKRSSVEQGRCGSIGELLQDAPALLDKGYRYIGFKGGKPALAKATAREMEARDHYKYSSRKPNRNWIPLHSVISHYLKAKAGT